MNKSFLNGKIGFMAAAVIASVSVLGCNGTGSASNPLIDGVEGPNVAFVNNTFTMSTVLKNVSFDGGITMTIPHTQNSYIEVGPDFQSNGTLIQVGVAVSDLKFLQNNVNLLTPNELPGGRPLPGVINGELPSIAVQVPKFDNATFYIGPQVLGIFIPVKFDVQGVTGTFRFYDAENDPIGTISIVGEDANKLNSGFLLLISLTGKVAQIANL